MLELKNIVKDYKVGENTVRAIDGLSVEFRRSEFVAILGQSGCGKTTTMNIVGGLDKYTSGDLVVDGVSTTDFNDRDWDNYRNKRIGFVFQSYNLIPHLTVLANVEIALTISGVSQAERKQRAIEALESVGLKDHLNKKPNQLSGGQMQRVAIARAIVNNPEILLADEPTGALDTNTSEQIMQLIQKIASDRLVIMVTHNPELADKYATRIVKMKDGKLADDSNPYSSHLEVIKQEDKDNKTATSADKTKSKTSMSFGTALGLSTRNLLTKKKRSIMTSIAAAIGILGIGLILALSNGLNLYIDNMTKEQVDSLPVKIVNGKVATDSNAYQTFDIDINNNYEVSKAVRISADMVEFVKQMQRDNPEWFNSVVFNSNMPLRFLVKSPSLSIGGLSAYLNISTENSYGDFAALLGLGAPLSMIPEGTEAVFDRIYQVVDGRLPQNKNELLLVTNQEGQIDVSVAAQLGLIDPSVLSGATPPSSISFDDISKFVYNVPTNNTIYTPNSTKISNKDGNDGGDDSGDGDEDNGNGGDETAKPAFGYELANLIEGTVFADTKNIIANNLINDGGLETRIVGIVKPKKVNINFDGGDLLQQGIAYRQDLVTYIQEQNALSDIAVWMNDSGHASKFTNPLTGLPFSDNGGNFPTFYDQDYLYEEAQSRYGALDANVSPWSISIYVKDFASKQNILAEIDSFNASHGKAEQITYTDIIGTIASIMSDMVRIVSAVLIGFTAVSLVVSAVMISIITSISVLERTKEIGILRSIGARKKDVVRLFNAENIILGLVSGTIGILVAFGLSIAISAILSAVVGIGGMATVRWWHILVLLGVSTIISFIAGYLPSRAAAKKDPVLALRSE